MSRSRDCNLEGVPTEVNHSHLIPQGPPPLGKMLPASAMGEWETEAKGWGKGEFGEAVWLRFIETKSQDGSNSV